MLLLIQTVQAYHWKAAVHVMLSVHSSVHIPLKQKTLRMAHIRVHTSVRAADVTKLLLLNKPG